jgi:cytochrome c oxidase assembly protein subunit 15
MKIDDGRTRLSPASDPAAFSPWPHRLAVLLSITTFPLLFLGGLVTSKGAGLAVPDWPTTFGYNMFFYPWSQMIGDVFYEHSHRLVASFVGLVSIALAVIFWLRERRAWLRWLAVVALGLVIVQGVLGGLRVILLAPTLAIVHACFAQAFFALTISLALFTSNEWRREPAEAPSSDDGRLRRLATITTALIYVQVVFGAVLRHTGERLDAHLFFAALVALHVILLFLRVSRSYEAHAKLVRPAAFLGILLLAQLVLGAVSYAAKFTTVLRLPIDMLVLLTTTHVIVGALMLAAGVALTLRSYRLTGRRKPSLEPKALAEQFST